MHSGSRCRAGELEREMPFGVVRQLVEPVLESAGAKERARLLAGNARLALVALGRAETEEPGGASDRFVPINGLYWLLVNLCESRPS